MITAQKQPAGFNPAGCFHIIKHILKDIVTADITGRLRIGNDLSALGDLRPFVNNLVLQMYVFADHRVCQDHAVLYNSAFPDLASASDNTVFNSSLDQAAVGYNRIPDLCAVKILSGAGIVGPGVDRPFRIEQVLCCLEVNKRNIGVKIALEISDRSEVSSVRYAADIQFSRRMRLRSVEA